MLVLADSSINAWAPWVAPIAVTLLLAGAAAMWKLATTLARLQSNVSQELTHNGGSSLKDHARAARDNSEAAVTAAQFANDRAIRLEETMADLADAVRLDRQSALRNEGEVHATLRKIQHDATALRTALAVLTDHVDAINRDRLLKEQQWHTWAMTPGATPPSPTGITRPGIPPQESEN